MRYTHITKPTEVTREWFVVDATNLTLGRLSSEVAKILRGKHKPQYSPFIDTGDYVIIINAEKIKVTGKKLDQKIYYHHSGWVGGLKQATLKDTLNKKPEFVLEHSIKGMLPKNALGRQMCKKLRVYSGSTHEHQAQNPKELKIQY